MKKTLSISIIGILILSGLGAGASYSQKSSLKQSSYESHILNFEQKASIFESFEEGFGPWEADADMPWDPEKDTPPSWNVTRTQEYAHDGEWSLNFTANGLFDDGTVWIVREISLPPGCWDIGLEFYFWSMESEVNNWEVVAYIGEIRPEAEENFTVIGDAGIEGWSPYQHEVTIELLEQTTIWLALGYNIVWETWRTHYFDSVTISGLPNENNMVIIAPDMFSDSIQPLIDHKNSLGVQTFLKTTEEIYNEFSGRDPAEQIKYFIKYAKESWNTKYVMLVGGKDIMPVRFTRMCFLDSNSSSIYSYYISDLYFADLYFPDNSFCSWDSNNDSIFADKNIEGYVDDVDLYPDVFLGRILTNTESELETVVDKIINYENSAYNQNWLKNLILCGGDDARSFLIEAMLPLQLGRIGYPVFDGEFLGNQASQILSDFTAKKVYASGLFRPFVKRLTVNNINTAINEGAGFLMFNGHGLPDTAILTNFPFMKIWWLPKPHGYTSSDVEQLTNGYKLPVAIFGGCNCGDFNASQSPVAWKFIAHGNGGAIASFACTAGAVLLLSSLCTKSLHGHIIMSVFESYAGGTEIVGDIWSDSITNYLNDEDALELGDAFSMFNWHHPLSNHFVIEEWTLFGDPSLKIGGYP